MMYKVVREVVNTVPLCDKHELMKKINENPFSVLATVYEGDLFIYTKDTGVHDFRQLSKGEFGINSRSETFTEMMSKNNWGCGANDIYLFDSLKELVDTAEEKGWVL